MLQTSIHLFPTLTQFGVVAGAYTSRHVRPVFDGRAQGHRYNSIFRCFGLAAKYLSEYWGHFNTTSRLFTYIGFRLLLQEIKICFYKWNMETLGQRSSYNLILTL